MKVLSSSKWKISVSKNTFVALKNRNFQLYFWGQIISSIGTWMHLIAQGWLVYQLSKSEFALGILGFASAIPTLVISPWAGVVIDRVSTRKLLLLTQVASMGFAFFLAFLEFSGSIQIWHVVLLAMGLGIIKAIEVPGLQTLVAELVEQDNLSNAIALNSMIYNGARIVGPGIGGILLATLGVGWCFFFNGVTFFVAFLAISRIQLIKGETVGKQQAHPLRGMVNGIQYVLQHAELKALLLLAMIISLFGTPYVSLLPAFVSNTLNSGAESLGAINALSGVGSISAALILANLSNILKRGHWLFWANVVFPFLLIIFASSEMISLAFIISFGLGVCFMFQFTLINTLIQLNVANEMRGRILGLYFVASSGFVTFGNLLLGALAEKWSLQLSISFGAVMVLFLSAIVNIFIAPLRRLS